MTTNLRPYQSAVIDEFNRCVAEGERRIVLTAPTGSGKTIIAAEIIRAKAVLRRSVLILSHRREIISHTSRKLYGLNIRHGIIQAGFSPRPLESVQVASIQTLWTRGIYRGSMDLPPADLLIVDECHHAPANTYKRIIESYPESILLGLTATPCRGDGRGLGGIFETLIECPQVAELIEQKHLVKTRVYAPVDPDLTGVKTVAGDYVESQLADRMDKPKLIGDIVQHWFKFGERRKTVVFASGVQHSLHIRDEFVRAGVRAEHIDGSTPKEERDSSLARLASGEIDLITNCMVLTEGWDMPEVGCCILARPTKKMGLFRQMIGRVLRPSDGKKDAIVLDHSGAVFRHGFVEDPVEWTLDHDRKAESPKHTSRCEHHTSRLLECSQCSAIRIGGQPCPSCGFLPARPPKAVRFDDGDLAEVDRDRRTKPNLFDPEVRAQWHAMLIQIGHERDYKPGWASYKYKEKFGSWPPWGASPQPITPTSEVLSWVRSRQIAFAKRSNVA